MSSSDDRSASLIETDFGIAGPDAAGSEIDELLEAVFGPADEVAREVWDTLAKEELAPKAMASFLRRAAAAADPIAFVDRDQTARGLLNARMRVRWSTREARAAGHPRSLAGLTWSSLTDPAQDMVREGLLELAEYQDAVSRGTTCRKDRTDTVICELAEIFARRKGLGSPWRVPHAERSEFVRFAVSALEGHLGLTELSPGAISQRWRRLKHEEEQATAELAGDPEGS